jgi:hypothetical protein
MVDGGWLIVDTIWPLSNDQHPTPDSLKRKRIPVMDTRFFYGFRLLPV